MALSTESESYWSDRYLAHDTPWDAGMVTTPLKEYVDQLTGKNMKILIPGAGNAYEAEYLHQQGFRNVFVCDLSELPLRALHERCPDFPEQHLLHGDFFKLTSQYDLILEQTFFCALPPVRRKDYVSQCLQLLVPGGRLAGVLFDDPLNTDRPPYGGNIKEYEQLFQPAFRKLVLERCYNSIAPRAGREVFICLEKREVVENGTSNV